MHAETEQVIERPGDLTASWLTAAIGAGTVADFGVERIGTGAFYAPAATCPGDSGGPARDAATGDVVGVVSASDMDDNQETLDPTFYTRIDVWRPLFETAQSLVHGSSRRDLAPIPGCEVEE